MEYNLRFKNKSSNNGNVCIYQTTSNLLPNIMSLAWLVKKTNPNTNVTFTWTADYNFIWFQKGEFKTAAVFNASEVVDADPDNANTIILDYINGGFEFIKPPTPNSNKGSLTITESGNIPFNQGNVGIGMSNLPTFVKKTQPNDKLVFIPTPKFWIVFGDFQQSDILDLTQINTAKEIKFQPNVYTMTATLNQDNTITVE